MQTAMDEINLLNVAEGLPRLEMGIVVNTGVVVVGVSSLVAIPVVFWPS